MTARPDNAASVRWYTPEAIRLASLIALLAIVVLALVPGPALAQSGDSGAPAQPAGPVGQQSVGRVYKLVSGPDIRRLLIKMGYTVRLYRDKKGKPKIDSKLEGTSFHIGFYACTNSAEPRCQSIQLYSGYTMQNPVSYATLNAWNSARRYARGYRQPHNPKIVFLELDMPFQGVSEMTFRKQFDMFRRLNALFRKHIGFRK